MEQTPARTAFAERMQKLREGMDKSTGERVQDAKVNLKDDLRSFAEKFSGKRKQATAQPE